MDRGGSFIPSHSTQNFIVFATPLLSNDNGSNPPEASGCNNSNLPRRASIRRAAQFLHQASGRRILREPSRLVWEAAANELEERQKDWAYSRPVVVLDFLWNLVFVCIVVVVLSLSMRENPQTPLRVWIVGYSLQCPLHMVCVWFEYKRCLAVLSSSGGSNDSGFSLVSGGNASREDEFEVNDQVSREHANIEKWSESSNTLFSFIWWVVGFYWITVGAGDLSHGAPLIYWLFVVFLAFDVFFVVFCIALAYVIGIAVYYCLPCIIAIMYAMADQAILASSLWDKTVRLWDVFDNKGIVESFSHTHDIFTVSCRPDGKKLACSTLDGQIYFWDPIEGQLMWTIEGRRNIAGGRLVGDRRKIANSSSGKCFTRLSYYVDGNYILAAGRSKYICMYDVAE